MAAKHKGSYEPNIDTQLKSIISSVSQNTSLIKEPRTWSVVILTSDDELDWLVQWAQAEEVLPAKAGVVFCLDYLAARKVCPSQNEFYHNDIIGLLSGTASTAQLSQAVASALTERGYQPLLISALTPGVAPLQERLSLPPLVLPISVMVVKNNRLKTTGNDSGYCFLHREFYQHSNIDLGSAQLWWNKVTKESRWGRTTRHCALTQLNKALATFKLQPARTPMEKPAGMALLPRNLTRVLFKTAQRFPRPVLNKQRLRLAWVRFNLQKGRVVQAKSSLKQVQALEPYSPDVLITAAVVQWSAGQLQSALRTIQSAARFAPEEGLIYYIEGKIYHEMGILELAEQSLKQSLALNRYDTCVWLALAEVSAAKSGPEAAIAIVEEARSAVTLDAALLNKEGLCYSELGQDKKALAAYKEALVLKPGDPSILTNLGVVLSKQGEIKAALNCYDEALRANPNDAYLLNNKGFCLGQLERYEEALRCYEQAIATAAKTVDIGLLHNKATCLSKLGRYSEALLCYDQVLEYNPIDTITLNNRGLCLLSLNQLDNALDCYRAAIELEPNNGVVWGNKGACLLKQGRYKRALKAYERALTLMPDELVYYSGKGMCLDYLGHADEAAVYYNKALGMT